MEAPATLLHMCMCVGEHPVSCEVPQDSQAPKGRVGVLCRCRAGPGARAGSSSSLSIKGSLLTSGPLARQGGSLKDGAAQDGDTGVLVLLACAGLAS